MKYSIFKNIFLVLSLSLASCASIFADKSQSITVSTGDVKDVTCELFNGKGRYIVNSPGTIVIGQSCDDLNYICRKKGYNEIKGIIAFNHKRSTAGNLILGGGIGYLVDVGTGAACKYPETISLPMTTIID
tara:strand:- start:159 stop:551 length:393 start_codon:yes stop_codon:yes gene_type:complete